jgi:Secretory lipase
MTAATPDRALPGVAPLPFYEQDPLSVDGGPGSLISAVELAAPPGTRGWAILYRSTGPDGRPIAVSGLVLAPASADAHPVVAWAHGTSGLADACAPSRQGFESPYGDVLLTLVSLGFTVTATDYEGLGTPGLHPYLVGASEGHGILDSIRAVRLLPDAGAGATTVVAGISQGGHAALWAAELAPRYAPEIELAGVLAASPPIDLVAVREALIRTAWAPEAWFDGLLVTAAWSDHYGLPLDGLLTDEGLAIVREVATGCPGELPEPTADPFLVDPRTWPAWQPLLGANSPGQGAAAAPILVLAATEDEIVLPSTIGPGVDRLRRAGSSVDLRWIPGGHSATLESELGSQTALAWLFDRLGR